MYICGRFWLHLENGFHNKGGKYVISPMFLIILIVSNTDFIFFHYNVSTYNLYWILLYTSWTRTKHEPR